MKDELMAHTGWRRLDGGWAYLHGGGALGGTGAVAGVEASLPAALAPLILPAPPTAPELRSAICASLAVLDLAPDRVTVPTLGAVWRSILGAADFSVFVYGATGRFKTALASLLQQHFGAGFAAHRHRPQAAQRVPTGCGLWPLCAGDCRVDPVAGAEARPRCAPR